VTNAFLLGGLAAAAEQWADGLRAWAPPGAHLSGWNWHQPGWQHAVATTPGVCLLLLQINPQPHPVGLSERVAENNARAWLAQHGHTHRLFYLDLLPGEPQTQTLSRLLRALGYTVLQHPNNHAVWSCNGCSDPDCERRTFSRLVPPSPAPPPTAY
jgi:hypothetical protein